MSCPQIQETSYKGPKEPLRSMAPACGIETIWYCSEDGNNEQN